MEKMRVDQPRPWGLFIEVLFYKMNMDYLAYHQTGKFEDKYRKVHKCKPRVGDRMSNQYQKKFQ